MNYDIHCPKCNKKLMEISGIAFVRIKCPRCKLMVEWPLMVAQIVPENTPFPSLTINKQSSG